MTTREGYLSEDTIAALSTPTGGAIAIVRLSGPDAPRIHTAVVRTEQKMIPRKMVLASLYSNSDEVLDQAAVVGFVQPESYTGEHLFEYHIHGNAWIAHRLLETLLHQGARQALPGEFSFRAVRNGKLSLFQAQAVADLIAAPNDAAVNLALEKITGSQSEAIATLGKDLRNLAAFAEVGIDFADQDVDEVSLVRLKQKLAGTLTTLQDLSETYRRGVQLQDGIRVAFVGLPNAGKSSFFNALLGEDRSIVSDIAGTTRDVVRERLTLRGKKTTLTLRLEDTAGLRKTEDQVEKFGIERTLAAIQKADLILFIIDPTTDMNAVREYWLPIQNKTPTLAVLTKIDCTEQSQLQLTHEALTQMGFSIIIEVSAITGVGITQAAETIVASCENWIRRRPGELVLTRLDHWRAVQDTLTHLNRAQSAAELELFASDLRQGLSALGPLIGETLPDDILGKIFSDFCI